MQIDRDDCARLPMTASLPAKLRRNDRDSIRTSDP
jgi:hypothetical protein